MSLFINAIALCAQKSEVVLQSSMEYGKVLEFSANMVQGSTVKIDWGDGVVKEHDTKTTWGTPARITGKSLGRTIHIYGNLKELTVSKSKLTSLQLVNQDGLTLLDASDNELTFENLDLSGAPNLQNLNLDNNDIVRLNLMPFEKLQLFSINNNHRFTTAVFADKNVLQNISISNGDLAHFYPKPMPELLYLTLDNGDLTEFELNDNYPKLQKLSLAGHKNLERLDITTLPQLEELNISHTGISVINTTRNKQLTTLKAAHTQLRNLSLTYNTNVQTIDVACTKISRLDVSKLSRLRDITIDSTDIDRLDLTGKMYLSTIRARNTKIEFLDMHDEVGYNGLRWLDLRDNKNMTPQSLNFTFKMMPYHRGTSWSPNVLISGIPGAETADTSLLSYDEDNSYKSDVKGDGSASMAPVNITISNATGGSIALTQMQDDNSWKAVSTKATPGYPISVKATPRADYVFAGVKVNGKMYDDTTFVTSADATVEPVFRSSANDEVIKLTVEPGSKQQYFLGGDQPSSVIFIDWGDGEKKPYSINNGKTTVTNETGAAGNTITISGPVTYADFGSFPPYDINNNITGIDLTKANKLRTLSLYFNDIKKIDVSNLSQLEDLDLAYTGMSALDISHNPKLRKLRAYGNKLSALDITKAPELTYLDVKSNKLEELNTTNNNKLETLLAQNNLLTSLDVSAMSNLVELDFSNNQISNVNVTNAVNLKKLGASDNKLTSVDLSKNTRLQTVLLDKNQLEALDLSHQNSLTLVQVGGNGWDACTLNDLYYSLNEYPELQDQSTPTGSTLWVTDRQSAHENDAAHAESDIAASKGWKLNQTGDGTGCNMAYVTVLETTNGTVKLKDAKGNEVKSGDKVEKNSIVSVEATPASGYAVASVRANGKNVENHQFTVTRATDVMVRFTICNGIGTAKAGSVTVTAAQRAVIIKTDNAAKVAIFTANGQQVHEATVAGTQTVRLIPGLYILKVGNVRKTILVR